MSKLWKYRTQEIRHDVTEWGIEKAETSMYEMRAHVHG